MLFTNKKGWDSKLKYALWVDKISIEKSIGTYQFQIVYGAEAIFPLQLGFPVIKLLQEELEEPNFVQRKNL